MRHRLVGRRIAALSVAVLSAALLSAVYRSFVLSEFTPIRIGVVDAEQTASRRIVAIALPDLSNLRSQTLVFSFRLRNSGSEPRRIGLLGDGLPAHRVVVPPNRTIRWDIVLSPEIVQAIHAGTGNTARTLELTGDADVWAVMAFEVQNYHLRSGNRLMAVVLPSQAGGYTTGTRFLPVAIGLCVLALLNALASSKAERRSRRLIGDALAFTAFLVCLTCLALPRIAPYKVLLSPSAFWLVAAGVFARALLSLFHAPQTLVSRCDRSVRSSYVRGSAMR